MRGFNVAIPEVDIGDDLFVVNDQSGNYRRIQVKTVTAAPRTRTASPDYSARFQVPLAQLRQVFTPDLVYVFAVRLPSGWGPFLVIPRDTLLSLYATAGMGSRSKAAKGDRVGFYVSYDPVSVRCAGQSLAPFVNRFENLPDTLPGNDFE